MAKRARASGWRASSAGMWTRWMGPPTSPTDFRSSAFRWGWSTGPRARKPDEDGTLVAAVIYDPMRDELFTAERGRGTRLNGKPAQVSRIAGAGRGAAGHGLSQPQAPRQPEHSLLPRVHAALARGAAGRLGRARPGLRGLRPPGSILGVQSESVGYGGRNSAGGRSRRPRDGLLPGGAFGWTATRFWLRTALIHEELIGFFDDMFAGRDLVADSHAAGVCEKQGTKEQGTKARSSQ